MHFATLLDFHNLQNITLLGHSMGGKIAMLFATIYPYLVEKLIIADIGPKYYAPHHQSILEALNAVDFSKKPSRNEVDEIISKYISDFGTKQFLLKNVYWKTPEELGFRFNLPVFNEKISEIKRVSHVVDPDHCRRVGCKRIRCTSAGVAP